MSAPIGITTRLSQIHAKQTAIDEKMANVLAELAALRRVMQTCCLGANPPIPGDVPYLPPELPNIPAPAPGSGQGGILCRRIQREIDNWNSIWENILNVTTVAGSITAAGIVYLIGAAVAPETGGLSLALASGLASGLTFALTNYTADQLKVTEQDRIAATRAAYASRSGGSAAATDAAVSVFSQLQPEGGLYALGFRLFGGLNRAFDFSVDIGDLSGYDSSICTDCYPHTRSWLYSKPGFSDERIYVWDNLPMSDSPWQGYPARDDKTYLGSDAVPAGTTITNESVYTIGIAYWSAPDVLVASFGLSPGDTFTVGSNWYVGYVSSAPSDVAPNGTIVICPPAGQ